MRTATELHSVIGKFADYNKIDGVSFAVEIINTRERFGDVDYLIAPLSGSGSVWVSHWSVKNVR
jgi:hypothetical protein